LEATVRWPGPVRTCLGCLKPDRKDAMVRIVVATGGVQPDFEGRKPGRGGYLHPQDECLERFIRSKVREFRSLRVKIDREQRTFVVETIRERLDRKPPLE
jgi:predicted RNA-binding protein YlxR (DUF448 family)